MKVFSKAFRTIALMLAGCLMFAGLVSIPAQAQSTSEAETVSAMEKVFLGGSGNSRQTATDSDLEAYAFSLSAGLQQIPASALESEEAWQAWRAATIKSERTNTNHASINWGDAAKCAGGIALAAATYVTGLAVAKKLISLAKNIGALYNVLKKAQALYKLYQGIPGKKANALRLAIFDAFKETGGTEMADFALQLIFGVSAGTVAACVAAVKSA